VNGSGPSLTASSGLGQKFGPVEEKNFAFILIVKIDSTAQALFDKCVSG
jgi:hypothetical protein